MKFFSFTFRDLLWLVLVVAAFCWGSSLAPESNDPNRVRALGEVKSIKMMINSRQLEGTTEFELKLLKRLRKVERLIDGKVDLAP